MKEFPKRAAIVAGVAVLLGPALAAPAAAHVTANPDEADSPFFRTALRVGHGCEGSPTTAVRVQIPEGVENPRPEVVTGWDAELLREELDEPAVGSHGEEINDRVVEVAWTGGNLSGDQFQEFGLSFRVLEDAPEVLWFPTIQECEQGEHRWIDVPPSIEQWGDYDEPAPYVINAVGGAGEQVDELAATSEESDPAAADGAEAGTDPLTWVALVAGLLGLGVGGGALVYTNRRLSAGPTS